MWFMLQFKCNNLIKSMHRPGIERGSPAWQASILLLNHRCLVGIQHFVIWIQKATFQFMSVTFHQDIAI